jgi:hypothetical protein
MQMNMQMVFLTHMEMVLKKGLEAISQGKA